jgi:hypothetical protein
MKGRPERSGTGRPSSRNETTGGGQGGVPPAGVRVAPSHVVTALTGLREPIVVLLLIIGFMSWISGKPLDGLLILLAGVGLSWDSGRRSRQADPAEASPVEASPVEASPVEASSVEASSVEASSVEASSVEASSVEALPAAREDAVLTATAAAPPPASVTAADAASDAPPAPIAAGQAGAPRARARWRHPALLAAGLAGGVLYAVVVGSFSRYSWPATVPVAALGAAVVAIGWRGPRHNRPAQPRPLTVGLALWGVLAVACCLWELWSLLEQPNLATSSYAHPTISTLTDPVLGTWAGRSIVLAAWLGLGWFLVER